MDALEPQLTTREVTKQYFPGYTERYIRELVRRGEFGKKLVRLGKGWLIPVSAIKAYFARHTFAVTSNPARDRNPKAYDRRVSQLIQFRK